MCIGKRTSGFHLVVISMVIETVFCVVEFQSLHAKENLEARNNIMHDLKIEPIHNVKSPIDCLSFCVQIPECVSFFHHKKRRKCQLHRVVFANTAFWIPENGWKYYQAYAEKCPLKEGYIYNRVCNMCYKFYSAPDDRDIEGARNRCLEDNAKLIKVNSEHKQTHLEDYLGSSGFFDDEVYIQGRYNTSEGLWVYDDGSRMNYTNWGYPGNTPIEINYISINKYDYYRWKQVDGSESRAFVCEKII